ncbi:hypothetical protein [Novosphingobium guangzhouense]|uniref:Secreted protein n=1 Tax=Novosphingobium guangzhouense TaxID=1850347 RepID=A0A2K2FSB5_9SPHN|nr:hypothetical protein [Novosphingobium guangzhouense]PNU01677.1 hypothetical protein A8V01_11445 [Novosphingobium guangzhouense]
MFRKIVFGCCALGAMAGTPARADMPMLPPNYTTGIIAPVIMNQCTGGRCANNQAPQQRQAPQGSPEKTRITCANAHRMTPTPAQKAKHAQLIALCASIGL